MNRFVIHIHTGHGPTHYDLMLPAGAALATWQLQTPPLEAGPGRDLPARKLPDHRLAYLTYEGPLSGGRGQVKILDRGACEVLHASADSWRFRLDGALVAGAFELARLESGPEDWTFRRLAGVGPEAPDPDGADGRDRNLVLIGMPGVGKSTVGVLLAKASRRAFLDTDVAIQAAEGRALQEIIDADGLAAFCRIEERCVLAMDCRACVIATGGSVVYSHAAMGHLRQGGLIIHLDLELTALEKRLGDLGARGVVIAPGGSLGELYRERQGLYRAWADLTVACAGKTHEQVVAEIVHRTDLRQKKGDRLLFLACRTRSRRDVPPVSGNANRKVACPLLLGGAMKRFEGLQRQFQPNWQGLVDNILRKGTPDRVYFAELFHDPTVKDAIVQRFGLAEGLSAADPWFAQKLTIRFQRFCGLDYVRVGLTGLDMPTTKLIVEDTSPDLKKPTGRHYQDEHSGPIMSWEDFEKYPWPDPNLPELTAELEWYEKNLPDDMCISSRLIAHYAEFLAWLMGYEPLCYALFEQRDLVQAIADKVAEIDRVVMRRTLEFPRVKIIWGSDDMGFKTSLLISAADMRQFVLPGHRMCAKMAHDAGRLYVLHSCGKLTDIMADLIEDVKIDGKHSYEDTIEDVRQVKGTYGRRIALLGGIDVDFLCRSDEQAVRRRVRDTLHECLPGGGYCLGTGNSVANYIPLDNYLAMVDEGRLYAG